MSPDIRNFLGNPMSYVMPGDTWHKIFSGTSYILCLMSGDARHKKCSGKSYVLCPGMSDIINFLGNIMTYVLCPGMQDIRNSLGNIMSYVLCPEMPDIRNFLGNVVSYVQIPGMITLSENSESWPYRSFKTQGRVMPLQPPSGIHRICEYRPVPVGLFRKQTKNYYRYITLLKPNIALRGLLATIAAMWPLQRPDGSSSGLVAPYGARRPLL